MGAAGRQVVCASSFLRIAIEFKKFLTTLDREIPADLEVHVVLDNASPTNPDDQTMIDDPRH